jgi:hypothetical protein
MEKKEPTYEQLMAAMKFMDECFRKAIIEALKREGMEI